MSVKIDWNVGMDKEVSRVKGLLQNDKFTDCQFLVGLETDKAVVKIRGHKLILAMASPVFERMFYGSFDDDKSNEIRIPDIKNYIFHKMMDYIYFQKLELKTVEDAYELYSAAQKYMLEDLIKECRDYLIVKFNRSNVWQIYEFAVFCEDNNLRNNSVDWMARNALTVLKDPSFIHANLTTLITLFDKNSLNIESELDLFQALNKSALANGYFDTKKNVENKDVESERKLLREALKKIRFMCLAPEKFAIVAKSELLTDSEVLSILLNKLSPDIANRPMPEGFNKSRQTRSKFREP